jgi:peptidoglycan/LPS O-acetylase OafA/YrhL
MFSHTKHRRDIQVLRGLAVLAVILFHANESFFPMGYLGVDVFFVISGFVVTPLILRIFIGQTKGKGNHLSNLKFFYERRFYRLAPALVVTLTISAILIFLVGPISDHQRFANQGIATLLLVGNIGAYNFSGDYFSPNPNPLVHTWSLSVEEQIYIVLPILFMIILHKRTSLKKVAAIGLGIISAISFISFLFPEILQPIYARADINNASQISFYSPIDRIWQFTVGGLGFLWLDRNQTQTCKVPKGINLIGAIAIVIVLFSPIQAGPKINSILASLFALAVILFNSLDLLSKFLSRKLEWLGDRSYSIYLFHMPFIYIAKYAAITAGDGENRIIPTIFAVFMSIVIGAISYSKIENRFRVSRGNYLFTKRNTPVLLLVTFFLPLSVFSAINRAADYDYWGLDVKYPKVTSANSLLPICSERLYLVNNICTDRKIVTNKTAVLVGDSHAGHISWTLARAAKDNNWNLIYWRIPLVTFNEGSEQKFNAWVQETKPDLLIVSQYWRNDLNQDVIKSRILNLKDSVKEILFIENNPIFPDVSRFSLAGYLIAPFDFPKSYPISMMDISDKGTSDELSKWARDHEISTMNFNSLFCDSKNCYRYSDSGWLYTDSNHLSLVGAELTYNLFNEFLKRF